MWVTLCLITESSIIVLCINAHHLRLFTPTRSGLRCFETLYYHKEIGRLSASQYFSVRISMSSAHPICVPILCPLIFDDRGNITGDEDWPKLKQHDEVLKTSCFASCDLRFSSEARVFGKHSYKRSVQARGGKFYWRPALLFVTSCYKFVIYSDCRFSWDQKTKYLPASTGFITVIEELIQVCLRPILASYHGFFFSRGSSRR